MKPYRIEIYHSKVIGTLFSEDCWRIRITSSNGRVFGHEYNSKAGAQKSINAFLTAIQNGNWEWGTARKGAKAK